MKWTCVVLVLCISTALVGCMDAWEEDSYLHTNDYLPDVCYLNFQYLLENYTFCDTSSTTTWCGAYSNTVVSMGDVYYPCDHNNSRCVQAPTSRNANSPTCDMQPGNNDTNRAKCKYLKHSIPFEILSNTTLDYKYDPVPVQYLATFSEDELSITQMTNETIAYNQSITYAQDIVAVEIASASNFVHSAYIVVLTTSQLHIYTASLYGISDFSLSVCTRDQSILKTLSTVHDPRSNRTFISGLSGTNASFIEIDSNGCPLITSAQTWKFVSDDNSVQVSDLQDVAFLIHIEPNFNDTATMGCFTPLSARTLVFLHTTTEVFIFGFEANATQYSVISLETSNLNHYYSLENGVKITSLVVFGECFGDVSRPSQALWISMATFDESTDNASLILVSVDEFSLSPLGCDSTNPNWWLQPSAFRGNGCDVPTVVCQNGTYYGNKSECETRNISPPTLLSAPADNLVYRLQTSHYNKGENLDDYIHTFFTWKTYDIYMTVTGFQEMMCFELDPYYFFIENLTVISVGRPLDTVHISENGQHMFISYPKEQWEVTAHVRLLEICDILAQVNSSAPTSAPNSGPALPTTADFLQPYNATCNALNPAPFNTYDYMIYYSPCAGGGSCWRYGNYKNLSRYDLGNSYEGHPPASEYAIRPTSQFVCEPGFFCPGYGSKFECYSGHICPDPGLQHPVSCPLNPNYDTTCIYTRLTEPEACPDGMVCLIPSEAPVPAPPGYFITPYNRTSFYPCAVGDWCSLQRFNASVTDGLGQDLNCTEGTYCSSNNITAPTACRYRLNDGTNRTEYCPEGTTRPILCPAGYYCPTTMEIIPCPLTYYCPQGSRQAELCPAGSYCPSPAESYKCPKGHYCRVGFTAPEKCHPLVVCPAGTKAEKIAISGILFDIGIVVFLFGAYVIALKARDYLRNKREAQRRLSGSPASPQERGSQSIQLKKKQYTIDFGFENMGLELHGTKKKVLDGVTGTIRSGRVTAVMGPSGAGKTTFLTTLAGKASYGTRTGTVLINGVPADIKRYKKILGFVPQEDIMHREMTVKEIIRFNAEVRLPKSYDTDKKAAITNEVISVLGLWDIRHQVIGDETTRGISGGQRKRVNIGMELVADPTVIFLDEPTSGLDSTSSEEVVSCLRKVADLGLTIVTVLHQPRYEIFQLFHDVLLLGKGGKTVYIGPSGEALAYFESLGFTCPEHTNPPDFFMDVISGHVTRKGFPDFKPEDLFALWETHSNSKERSSLTDSGHVQNNLPTVSVVPKRQPVSNEIEEEPNMKTPLVKKSDKEEDLIKRQTAGFFKQLLLFTSRALVQQTRDLKGFFWDNALIVIAGTLLGALYIETPYTGPVPPSLQALCPAFMAKQCSLPQNDKINAMAALVSLSIGFTAMAASLRCFGTEKVIFWRESAAGINKVAYFLGKNIAQLVNISLAPIVFLSVFYTLTSPRGTFGHYYIILLLLQFAIVGMGYLISVMMPYKNAQLTGVVIALVCAMFGGGNPSLRQLKSSFPTRLVSCFSPNRWAQEALYLTEIDRYSQIYDIKSSLDIWGFVEGNRTLDLVILLAIGLGARFLGLLCMMLMNRDKMK